MSLAPTRLPIGAVRDASQLLRSILRLNRRLPPAVRKVGDEYVMSEFRRVHAHFASPVSSATIENNVKTLESDNEPWRVLTREDEAIRVRFMLAWLQYVHVLQEQLSQSSLDNLNDTTPATIGKSLTPAELDSLSETQLGQLYALKQAAKDPSKV